MWSNILTYRGSEANSDGKLTVNASQHAKASQGITDDFGRALRHLLEGWEQYAKAHEKRFEDKIGNDGVLGRYWAETGLAIKRLLDGETGGFDCGSIAANITDAIEAQGLKTDGYTLLD